MYFIQFDENDTKSYIITVILIIRDMVISKQVLLK